MQLSARNQLGGTITKVEHGAVNTEVAVELAVGVEIVSIITKESAQHLNLSVGDRVFAVIKASDVMIATE